jgi:diguanylate cyclase (GGDEF)-like protein
MLAALALGKIAAGPNVSFSAVALLPVAYVAWFISRGAGLAAATASAATLFVANLLILHRHATAFLDLWNASMDVVVFAVLAWSLSETKAQYVRVRQLAREDPLTKLLNRRSFLEVLKFESRRARRYHEAITVAYIDLDGFKRINDSGGHAAGDRCLMAVAALLRSAVREVDFVGRVGGDEFAVALTRISGESSAMVLAEIAATLRLVDAHECPQASVSIGAVTFSHPDDDPEALVSAADRLMYMAKRAGKNHLVHQQQ